VGAGGDSAVGQPSKGAAATKRRAVPESEWLWFGKAGHLIVGNDCRFHLCTLIGKYLISTVGEYLPDSQVREITAASKGVTLEGRGDAREADFMRKIGYEEIGHGRRYETMVFKAGKRCTEKECGCGQPEIDGHELAFSGYNTAGAAAMGHMEHCRAVAAGKIGRR
jgi:hypothetical protein